VTLRLFRCEVLDVDGLGTMASSSEVAAGLRQIMLAVLDRVAVRQPLPPDAAKVADYHAVVFCEPLLNLKEHLVKPVAVAANDGLSRFIFDAFANIERRQQRLEAVAILGPELVA